MNSRTLEYRHIFGVFSSGDNVRAIYQLFCMKKLLFVLHTYCLHFYKFAQHERTFLYLWKENIFCKCKFFYRVFTRCFIYAKKWIFKRIRKEGSSILQAASKYVAMKEYLREVKGYSLWHWQRESVCRSTQVLFTKANRGLKAGSYA